MTVAIMLLTTMLSVGADDLDQSQILQRHAATIDRFKHCSLTTEERRLLTAANSDLEQLFSIRECQIRLDGRRSNLLVHETNSSTGVNPSQAVNQGDVNEFNQVCNDQVLRIYYPRQTIDVRPPAPTALAGRLSPSNQDELFIHRTIGNAAIAFGFSSFNTPMPLSRLVSLSTNARMTRDDLGYCVQGTSPDGTSQKIWFDPTAGFHVRRLVFEQSGDSLNDNRFQHNRRVLKRYGFSDSVTVKSVSFEIRNVQIEPKKDTYVITGLEAFKTILASDGTKAVEHTIHRLTDWNLEPDFSDATAFQPWLPVPEGMPVRVDGAESLDYVYRNGRIELAVNTETVERLKRVELSRRSRLPHMQWIWGVVVAILGFAWWRMRSTSAR